MSEKPLVSPEELASVLSDDGHDEAPREDAAPAAPSTDRYSLRRPLAIPPDAETVAKRRLAETARTLAGCLSATLDAAFDLEVHGFQQQQVRAAIDRLSGPAWVLAFGAGDGGSGGPSGGIALGLDPSSALAVVELVLGGSGTYSAEGRMPTRLETRVMEKLARHLARDLGAKLDRPLGVAAFQVGAAPRAVASPGEMVGAGLLRIRISGSERNGVLLVTPDLLRETGGDDEPAAHAPGAPGPLARKLLPLRFEARPVLRAGVSTLDELSNLTAGSILRLDAPADAPLELRVGGVPLFAGRIDRSESGAAFRVERRRVPDAPAAPGSKPTTKGRTA